MGYAIALEAANRGALVNLISGPVNLSIQHPNITLQKVTTAAEMYAASKQLFPSCDMAIMSAAVADFTPANVSEKKIKDKQQTSISLVPTTDIAAELGRLKQANQKLVGFALETDDELENAKRKLKKKNLDFIVLNSLQDKNAGFKFDTNKITIIDSNNNISEFELKLKQEVAVDILDEIEKSL
jgi:phosphopantothenoylcysteine synthetase/decarboxylase